MLTKFSHFIYVKATYYSKESSNFYLKDTFRIHGIPLSIVSDRGNQFNSHFWKTLQSKVGTKVKLSTAFHPQTDGLEERTIQTLEDMLRACVIDFKGNWYDHLPLI